MATKFVLTPDLLSKIRLMDMAYYSSGRPGRFAEVFSKHKNQTLSWEEVVTLYLEAQHARYNPYEILWMQNIRTTNDYMLWFGVLATDGKSLMAMLKSFRNFADHDSHLHVLWENIMARDLEKSTASMVFSWAPPAAFSDDETISRMNTK